MASGARLGHKGTKRSKAYFRKCSSGKRPRWERKLDVGMQGVLITCNRDEKQCIREAYDLLTEFADELYGAESKLTDEVDSDDDGDIADALEKEVSRMKQQRSERKLRFQAVDSRAKNLIFIRTRLDEDPANLVHHMLTKMKEAGKCKSKHIQRILPASVTCRATLDQIEKAVRPLLEPLFHADDSKDSTFAILVKTRNNNQIHRAEVITVVANAVTSGSKFKHTVDLDDPEYSIMVEVICNVCCLSVLKDYDSLKKYNIHAIVGEDVSQVNKSKTNQNNERTQKLVAVDQRTETGERDSHEQTKMNKESVCLEEGQLDNKCLKGETELSLEKQQRQEERTMQNDEGDVSTAGEEQQVVIKTERKCADEEKEEICDGIRIF